MKFYELPQAVEAAIKNTDVRPFVRVLFELADGDVLASGEFNHYESGGNRQF